MIEENVVPQHFGLLCPNTEEPTHLLPQSGASVGSSIDLQLVWFIMVIQ